MQVGCVEGRGCPRRDAFRLGFGVSKPQRELLMKKLSKPMRLMNFAVMAGMVIGVLGLLASEVFGLTLALKIAIILVAIAWIVAVVSWVMNLFAPTRDE